jgi:hypothetical protein
MERKATGAFYIGIENCFSMPWWATCMTSYYRSCGFASVPGLQMKKTQLIVLLAAKE